MQVQVDGNRVVEILLDKIKMLEKENTILTIQIEELQKIINSNNKS